MDKTFAQRKERAVELFGQKFHCSQAVLAACADMCGITEGQALRLGSCFGSGMRRGEVCGACTGALMCLGSLYGQDTRGDMSQRERANRVCDMMTARFAEKTGSLICNELLGIDVSTPEGAAEARAKGLFTDFCPKMVAAAMDVLETVIADEELIERTGAQ